MFAMLVSAEPGPVLVDRVVATVDRRVITLSQLRARVKEASMQSGTLDVASRKLIEGEQLNQLIEERLIEAAARGLLDHVTEKELEDFMGRVAATDHFSRDQALKRAQEQGLSQAEYLKRMRGRLIEEQWLDDSGRYMSSSLTPLDLAKQRAIARTQLLRELKSRATIRIYP